MSIEPYYEGNAVPLNFYVKEGLRPLVPQSATVIIYRGRDEILPNTPAIVVENRVSFVVPVEYTKLRGDYKAEFTIYLTPTIPRTHVVWFRILPKGAVVGKARDAELTAGLDKKSSGHAADVALGLIIRSLRRMGEGLVKTSNRASDIVAKATNRKMPLDHYTPKEEDY